MDAAHISSAFTNTVIRSLVSLSNNASNIVQQNVNNLLIEFN
jgi:hypothetical protein